MTLNQALASIKGRKGRGQPRVHYLVCGFEPLHLATFFNAFASERFPEDHVEIATGLYGDIPGSLAKAASSQAIAAAVIFEWSDIDPRLGIRSSGGWSDKSKRDILACANKRCADLMPLVRALAARMPVAIAPPGLPLPPIGNTIRSQSSVLELELVHLLDGLLLDLAQISGVRIVDRAHLEQLSPAAARLDAKMELVAGFPYTIAHASALARSLVNVLYPQVPKKGLITDLDDTLWAGIIGEIGAEGVSWHQDSHTQIHGLYQQMLGHLADCGVLLGVSSKNELATAKAGLSRKDLLIDAESLFPVLADWGTKSRAVAEILRTWNIGADAVVFVDDNPMELSEVQQAFPQMTCFEFPKRDPAKVWNLLGELRDLFGKPVLLEEDRLRRNSIRAASQVRESGQDTASPEFLRGLEGTVTLDSRKNPADKRPLELINKTNQFNLNGLRVTEGEWQRCLESADTQTLVISYQDKFGPLGKIGVVLASEQPGRLHVSHWVMSCRAFSRQIEHHTLDTLFRRSNASQIEFGYRPTERNQPLQEFFERIGVRENGHGTYVLPRAEFEARCESLPHQVSE